MVAVVSGSGLGLFGSSGSVGNPLNGRGGERVYVNTSTGNLVVQGIDETLVARGLDLAVARTYNSQGLLDDDNGDNWRLGVHQSLEDFPTTINAIGSTITKVFGDGRRVVYTYDEVEAAYVSDEGEGAHDTLTFADAAWTWTDGSGRNQETYDANGRMLSASDQDDNVISYGYDQAGLLRTITDASGQLTELDYAGGNLTQIRVTVPRVDLPSVTQTLTRYIYDSQDRLRQVIVDLTPQVNGASTTTPDSAGLVEGIAGESYVTTYSYQGNTHLISSITQTDGSSVSFTYELIAGQQRVTSYTDGEGRTTTLQYSNVSSGLAANPGALTSGDTQSVTSTHPLNEALLSTGGGSGGQTVSHDLLPTNLIAGSVGAWQNATTLPASSNTLTKFNALGNGIAVRLEEIEGDLAVFARFYAAASETWSAETRVDDLSAWDHHNIVDVALDDAGNAVVVLMPEGPTSLPHVSVNVYNAGTATWSGSTALTNSSTTTTFPGSANVEMRDGRAVVTWSETDTVTEAVSYHASVLSSSGWPSEFSYAVSIPGRAPMAGVDDLGNAWVVWTEYTDTPDPGDVDLFAASNGVRFNAATGTWSAVTPLDVGAFTLAVGSDANGRAIRLSLSDSQLLAQRFNTTTGTWGASTNLGQFANGDYIQAIPTLSFDAAGNAIVLWARDNILEVRRFDVDTGAWQPLESFNVGDFGYAEAPIWAMSASINGDRHAITWLAHHDDQMRVFAMHGNNGVWALPVEVAAGDIVGPEYGEPGAVLITLDSGGKYTVTWQVWGPEGLEVRGRRYSMLASHASYRVPQAATWQSIAFALYGVSTVAAANALRDALGNPTLATGIILSGLPQELELPAVATYDLDPDALQWAGASSSPVVQTFNDEAGRLVGTLHANGTLTTYARNAAGAIVSQRHHVGSPVTPLWSQDFSSGTTGLSPVHAGFMTLVNGGLVVTTRDDVSPAMVKTLGTRTHDFDDHVVFRGEVTTGESFEWRVFNFGAQSVDASRGHSVEFSEDSVYALFHNGTEYERVRLGVASNNTTYVVEVVTHAAGSTLYVYEKGTDRLNGFVHQAAATDWTDARMFFETLGGYDAIINSIRLDNLSEASVPGQLIGGLIAAESAQDTVGYTTGWSTARFLETSNENARTPQVVHDESGNALAAWVQGNQVAARRYDAATGRWGAITIVHTGGEEAANVTLELDRQTGHAVMVWMQGDGTANSLYASRLNPQTGLWSAGQLLETSNGDVSAWESASLSVNGNRAAVAWIQHNGVANDVVTSRFDGTSWSAAAVIDTAPDDATKARVGIDAAGNATYVWSEWSDVLGDLQLQVRRWVQGTQSYSAIAPLDPASWTERSPKIELDASGNVYVLWYSEFRRFHAASGEWTPTFDLDGSFDEISQAWDLAVDSQGNAIASWVEGTEQGNMLFARLFNGGTQLWGERQIVANLGEEQIDTEWGTSADIVGGHAVVGWIQSHGSENSAFASILNDGIWSAPRALESRLESPLQLEVSIDAGGNAAVVWAQGDGGPYTIFESRYNAQLPLAYVVPAGATWQAIANAIYGVNSELAGNALRDAVGNPTLTEGLRLSDLPATLAVTGSEGQYYSVPENATWQWIANQLYGINRQEAGLALSSAMGNVTLTTGLHLTNLPAELAVLSQVAVAPYYTVQAADTWASITLAIYGSDDAAAIAAFREEVDPDDELQLVAGLRITPPLVLAFEGEGGSAALFLETNVTNDVGETTTYRKDDQGRLRAVLSPAIDGVRLETRYFYDVRGNLTSMVEDPTGANRITTFEYDERGNLELTRDATGNTVTRTYNASNQMLTETRYRVADPDGGGPAGASQALTTRYVYDGDDHLRFMVSAEGTVVENRYSLNGQIENSRTYTEARYDAEDFALTALEDWAEEQDLTKLARVDYTYDFRGNVRTTTQWKSTDELGAGLGIGVLKTFVYDQRGRLLQTLDGGGDPNENGTQEQLRDVPFATTFTYDGMGRVLSSTRWISVNADIKRALNTTLTSYDDANRETQVTLNNGHVTTSVFNTAGELITIIHGVNQGFGRTSYHYDDAGRLRMTLDPTDVPHFYYYDDAGRKIAEVDADGSLVEFVYDRLSQVVKTIQYATRIDPATLIGANQQPVERDIGQLRTAAGGDSPLNRITRAVYDAAGRLAYTVDARGSVSRLVYDGSGQVTEEVRFFDMVDIERSVGALAPSAFEAAGAYALALSQEDDRRIRHFYDADGNRIGTLDAEGYLTEFEYDGAGRLIHQIGYATQVAEANRNAATLDLVRPPLETDSNTWIEDIHTYMYYDGMGRVIGVLDGKGILTTTLYDGFGRVFATTRYGREIAYTPDFATAATEASGYADYGYGGYGYGYGWVSSEVQFEEYQYDGAGNVTSVFNHENVHTAIRYDEMGRAERQSRRNISYNDPRTTRVRYDDMGRVTQELSPKGVEELEGGVWSAQDVERIWDEHGVRYTYDLAGRRTSATVRPDAVQTLTTWFFYDQDGRKRFDVNARGERTEYFYDTFGQLEHVQSYYDRLTDYPDFSAQDLQQLGGGLLDSSTTQLLSRGQAENRFSRTTYTYNENGQVATQTTLEGSHVATEYNAFGEVRETTQAVDTRNLVHRYEYDRRGLLKETFWDPNGFNTNESREYDAFGRLESLTDARRNQATFEYDTLHRQTAAVDAEGRRVVTSHDAFSRIRSVTPMEAPGSDASGGISFQYYPLQTYTYTRSNRHSFTSWRNGHGDIIATQTPTEGISNPINNAYDANGNLVSRTQDFGFLEQHGYDRANRRLWSMDGSNTTTTFQYDEANRVIRQVVDSVLNGLQLETEYEYDALGRVERVSEPNGRVTETEYDDDGRVVAITVNPGTAHAIVTEYQYNLAGQVVLKIEDAAGAPRRTAYEYDVLGRMTRMIVDPENAQTGAVELNLVTQYFYDANGNLTREIKPATHANQPTEHSTWYVYDETNLVVQTIDALGGVTENTYDHEGKISHRRRYATAVDVSQFGNEVGLQQPGTTALDRVTQSFYNLDGQEQFTLDGMGGVTEREYDAQGRVIFERLYGAAVDMSQSIDTIAELRSALTQAGNSLTIPNLTSETWLTKDHIRWMSYDGRGRLSTSADFGGALTSMVYDNSDRLVATRTNAAKVTQAPVLNTWDWWSQRVTNTADPAVDRITRFWHDSLGRVRFTLDAEGYLSETVYDTVARTETRTIYATSTTELLPNPENAGTAAIEGILASLASATDQTTLTQYDINGRVERVTFDDGTYEEFTYDGLGNRETYRNQAGSIWTYVYDANGRLLEEHSPVVSVTTVVTNGSGLEANAPVDAVIVTRMTYDALGNVATRTEGIKIVNGVESAADARTTTYEYDLLGRQVATIFPVVQVYSAPPGDESNTNPAAMLQERTEAQPTARVTYNTLGDAVMNVDVTGAISRKAYDNLGRVKFDVDALGFVTGYDHDVFGNVIEVTRRATALANADVEGVWSAAQIAAVAPNAADRTMTFEYDRRNNQTAVFQPEAFAYSTYSNALSQHASEQAAETRFEYNVFGQVTNRRVRLHHVAPVGTSLYAETRFYYDRNGRQRYEVNAANYITRTDYDARGNVVRQIEFAVEQSAAAVANFSLIQTRVPPSLDNLAGYDRDVEYVYDGMGRLTEQRIHNVEYMDFAVSTENPQFGTQVTTFGYDAVGNRTRLTTHRGAGTSNPVHTYTYFDALGRIVAMAEPERLADSTGDFATEAVVPFVEMRRDVYGNLVQEIRYRESAVFDLERDRYVASGGIGVDDHVSLLLLDSYGRARRTQDAVGAVRHASYTLRGDIAKEWQTIRNADGVDDTIVTIRKYDLLGREIATIEPMRKADPTVTTVGATITESMRYWQPAGGAELQWYGTNRVFVSYPELDGIDIQIELYIRRLDEGGGPGLDHLVIQDFDNTRGGEMVDWTDPAASNDAGVHSIRYVLVYQRLAGGGRTLVYDSNAQPNASADFYRDITYTQVKYNAFGEITDKVENGSEVDLSQAFERQEYFEYDNAGRVRRSNSGDGVDKLYFYDLAGRATLEMRSRTAGLIASYAPGQEAAALAATHEQVMRTETIYNALDQVTMQRKPIATPGTAAAPTASDVTVLLVDSEALEQMPNPDPPYDFWYRWEDQNIIEFSWADVGTQPVQIRYTYTTKPGSAFGFNAPQSETRERIVQDLNGGTGFRDEWITVPRLDQWSIEQGIATSFAGVSVIHSVEVFGQDASGNYTVLLRGLGVPTGPAPTAQPYMTQESDRWGNVISFHDEAANHTRYRYSVLGSMVEKTLPQVSVLDTRDAPGNDRFAAADETPVQRNYFDILGRGIGTRDANGNLNRISLNQVGQVESETHADTGTRSYVYDTFGNQVQMTNELTWRTRTTYDRGNRATSTATEYDRSAEGSSYLTREFQYDDAGRRISETSGELMTGSTTAAETTKYFYDFLGNMVERRTALGHRTLFEYDARGNKVFQQNGDGFRLTWDYDKFNRVISHQDMGGRVTEYEYNGAGLLSGQSRIDGVASTTDQQITYHYDEAGRLIQIDDDGVNRVTDYIHDQYGRRVGERTAINGFFHQNTQIEYDSHGRMSELTGLQYSITYQYDAQGNRTRIAVLYRDHENTQTGQELWYTYDSMNRVELSQGTRTGNALDISEQRGVLLTYYLDGQRESAIQYGNGKLAIVTDFDDNSSSTVSYSMTHGRYQEVYQYDGAQRLISVERGGVAYDSTNGLPDPNTEVEVGPMLVSQRFYDGASRLRMENWLWGEAQSTESVYDDDGRFATQTVRYGSSAGQPKSQTTFHYNAADVLNNYVVNGYELNGNLDYTAHYYNSYLYADTYIAAGESIQTNQTNAPHLSGSIIRGFNANDELVSVVDDKDRAKSRFFANNAQGQAMAVIQGDYTNLSNMDSVFINAAIGVQTPNTNWHRFYFANGQNVGSVGRLNPGGTAGAGRANFDVNYTPLDQMVASAPTQIVVQEGDTLRSLAARIYGDEGLWYLIAEENGESDPSRVLETGRLLRLPVQVVSLANSAASFKAFDVGQVIGDLTPTQAPLPPQAEKGCGIFGQILVIIIVIVVTYLSWGSGSGWAAQLGHSIMGGTIGTGAAGAVGMGIAAAAGSVIGQGVGIAVGAQDKFSWASVAAAAFTAGITQGISSGLENVLGGADPNLLQLAAKGAINGVVNQGVNLSLGLQDSFSWRELAVSAVSAATIGAATKGMKDGILRDTVSAVTSVGVRRVLGGKMEASAVIADVFANVIGNAIARDLAGARAGRLPAAGIKADVAARQMEFEAETRRMIMAKGDADITAALAAYANSPLDFPLDSNPRPFDLQVNATPDEVQRTSATSVMAPEGLSTNYVSERSNDLGYSFRDENGVLNLVITRSANELPGADAFTSSSAWDVVNSAATRDYWDGLAEKAEGHGLLEFFGYAGAKAMGAFGAFGHSLADMAVGAYEDPASPIRGAMKYVANFGPETANLGINGVKLVSDGWSHIGELVGLPKEWTENWRSVEPLTIDPLLTYNGAGESLGPLLGEVIPPFIAGIRSGKRSCGHRQLLHRRDAA